MTPPELLDLYIATQRRQWLDRLRAAYAKRNIDQETKESWEDEDRTLWPEFEERLREEWLAIRAVMAGEGVDLARRDEMEAKLSSAARDRLWDIRLQAYRTPDLKSMAILEDTGPNEP